MVRALGLEMMNATPQLLIRAPAKVRFGCRCVQH